MHRYIVGLSSLLAVFGVLFSLLFSTSLVAAYTYSENSGGIICETTVDDHLAGYIKPGMCQAMGNRAGCVQVVSDASCPEGFKYTNPIGACPAGQIMESAFLFNCHKQGNPACDNNGGCIKCVDEKVCKYKNKNEYVAAGFTWPKDAVGTTIYPTSTQCAKPTKGKALAGTDSQCHYCTIPTDCPNEGGTVNVIDGKDHDVRNSYKVQAGLQNDCTATQTKHALNSIAAYKNAPDYCFVCVNKSNNCGAAQVTFAKNPDRYNQFKDVSGSALSSLPDSCAVNRSPFIRQDGKTERDLGYGKFSSATGEKICFYYCASCTADSDCASGQKCCTANGKCYKSGDTSACPAVTSCSKDSDCSSGYKCCTGTKTCYQPSKEQCCSDIVDPNDGQPGKWWWNGSKCTNCQEQYGDKYGSVFLESTSHTTGGGAIITSGMEADEKAKAICANVGKTVLEVQYPAKSQNINPTANSLVACYRCKPPDTICKENEWLVESTGTCTDCKQAYGDEDWQHGIREDRAPNRDYANQKCKEDDPTSSVDKYEDRENTDNSFCYTCTKDDCPNGWRNPTTGKCETCDTRYGSGLTLGIDTKTPTSANAAKNCGPGLTIDKFYDTKVDNKYCYSCKKKSCPNGWLDAAGNCQYCSTYYGSAYTLANSSSAATNACASKNAELDRLYGPITDYSSDTSAKYCYSCRPKDIECGYIDCQGCIYGSEVIYPNTPSMNVNGTKSQDYCKVYQSQSISVSNRTYQYFNKSTWDRNGFFYFPRGNRDNAICSSGCSSGTCSSNGRGPWVPVNPRQNTKCQTIGSSFAGNTYVAPVSGTCGIYSHGHTYSHPGAAERQCSRGWAGGILSQDTMTNTCSWREYCRSNGSYISQPTCGGTHYYQSYDCQKCGGYSSNCDSEGKCTSYCSSWYWTTCWYTDTMANGSVSRGTQYKDNYPSCGSTYECHRKVSGRYNLVDASSYDNCQVNKNFKVVFNRGTSKEMRKSSTPGATQDFTFSPCDYKVNQYTIDYVLDGQSSHADGFQNIGGQCVMRLENNPTKFRDNNSRPSNSPYAKTNGYYVLTNDPTANNGVGTNGWQWEQQNCRFVCKGTKDSADCYGTPPATANIEFIPDQRSTAVYEVVNMDGTCGEPNQFTTIFNENPKNCFTGYAPQSGDPTYPPAPGKEQYHEFIIDEKNNPADNLVCKNPSVKDYTVTFGLTGGGNGGNPIRFTPQDMGNGTECIMRWSREYDIDTGIRGRSNVWGEAGTNGHYVLTPTPGKNGTNINGWEWNASQCRFDYKREVDSTKCRYTNETVHATITFIPDLRLAVYSDGNFQAQPNTGTDQDRNSNCYSGVGSEEVPSPYVFRNPFLAKHKADYTFTTDASGVNQAYSNKTYPPTDITSNLRSGYPNLSTLTTQPGYFAEMVPGTRFNNTVQGHTYNLNLNLLNNYDQENDLGYWTCTCPTAADPNSLNQDCRLNYAPNSKKEVCTTKRIYYSYRTCYTSPWWQASGGNIFAQGDIIDHVPTNNPQSACGGNNDSTCLDTKAINVPLVEDYKTVKFANGSSYKEYLDNNNGNFSCTPRMIRGRTPCKSDGPSNSAGIALSTSGQIVAVDTANAYIKEDETAFKALAERISERSNIHALYAGDYDTNSNMNNKLGLQYRVSDAKAGPRISDASMSTLKDNTKSPKPDSGYSPAQKEDFNFFLTLAGGQEVMDGKIIQGNSLSYSSVASRCKEFPYYLPGGDNSLPQNGNGEPSASGINAQNGQSTIPTSTYICYVKPPTNAPLVITPEDGWHVKAINNPDGTATRIKVTVFVEGNLRFENPFNETVDRSNNAVTAVDVGNFLSFIVSGDIRVSPDVGINMPNPKEISAEQLQTCWEKQSANLPTYPNSGSSTNYYQSSIGLNETLNPQHASAVGVMEGVFITNGNLVIERYEDLSQCGQGNNVWTDKRFISQGSLIAWGNSSFLRDFNQRTRGCQDDTFGYYNNRVPTETFIYRPDLVRNMPFWMRRSTITYQDITGLGD